MEICLVSQLWYEYSTGGVENYLYNILNSFKGLFTKVHIVVPSLDKLKIEVKGNIIVYKVPFLPFKGDSNKGIVKKSRLVYEFLDNLLQKEDISIVETEQLTGQSSIFFSLLLATMRNKIPLVERLHTVPNNPVWLSINKDLSFSKIFCMSKFLSEYMYREGVRANKLEVIYPGIDTKLFSPKKSNLKKELGFKKKDILLLHASRIVGNKTDLIETKGIRNLLKSISIVSESHDNVKLLLAVAKPLKNRLNRYVKEIEKIKNYCSLFDIEDKVVIKEINYTDMPKAYNACDIFVMMSLEETFGLVYAEAMACEKPVIASSICAMPEIIVNNETGYLVAPDDSVELSKRIHWLVNDKEKRIKFGKEGRKKIIGKFENNQIAIELKKSYEIIIKKYKKINK